MHYRPYLFEFLEEMTNHYTLVLFTASAEQYANLILNQMFKKIGRNLFSICLFRDSCTVLKPSEDLIKRSSVAKTEMFVKDLSLFNKDLR